MKNTFFTICILLFVLFTSCKINDDKDIKLDDKIDPDKPGNVIKTPCDFDLSEIKPNDKVVINCFLDLRGDTILLPENVSIDFEGGDIVNGKLIFSGGTIDGRLLSSRLTVEGDVKLKDTKFDFFAIRWGVREGEIKKTEAFENHQIIQRTVDLVKSLGGTVFNIGKMDAYFDTDDVFVNAVRLPSDFHFKMSEKTHFRVFPSDKKFATRLFMIQDRKNVTLSGGFLHGERDTHTGPPTSSATLVNITTGYNVLVENVHISNSGVSGLTINSLKFATDPDYVPSEKVRIKGCTFDSNRRNNLSVTDGKDIIIEDCKILRAGIDTEFSKGSNPWLGLDVEPTELQKIDGVIVRNCIEREGARGSLVASGGNNITFEGNDVQRSISYNIASNVKIINNTLRGGSIFAGLKNEVGMRLSKGNVVSGNKIMDAIIGIKATNKDIQIFENEIVNCEVGMIINSLTKATIYDNIINSDKESSFGFTIQDYANDVVFRNNKINVNGRCIFSDFPNFDQDERSFKISFIKNTFEATKFSLINGTVGMTLSENLFKSGVRISGSQNILFDNNKVMSGAPFSIEVSNSEISKDITVSNNTIENSDERGFGHGIKSSSTSDIANESNILIDNNTINVKGTNSAISFKKFSGVTITNNTGKSENGAFILFNGDNSVIKDNFREAGKENVIEGDNNVVAGNN